MVLERSSVALACRNARPQDLEVFWPIDVRLSPVRQIAPDVTATITLNLLVNVDLSGRD